MDATVSSTTVSLLEISEQCSKIYGYSSGAILIILGVTGLVFNSVLLGCVWQRDKKVATDVAICAMALVDISFNLLMTPNLVWSLNYDVTTRKENLSSDKIEFQGLKNLTKITSLS